MRNKSYWKARNNVSYIKDRLAQGNHYLINDSKWMFVDLCQESHKKGLNASMATLQAVSNVK